MLSAFFICLEMDAADAKQFFKPDRWMILSSLKDAFLGLPLLFWLQILPESLYCFTILPKHYLTC